MKSFYQNNLSCVYVDLIVKKRDTAVKSVLDPKVFLKSSPRSLSGLGLEPTPKAFGALINSPYILQMILKGSSSEECRYLKYLKQKRPYIAVKSF
jgi:hypothetical protein